MAKKPEGKRPPNCFIDPKSPYWQYDFSIKGERDRGSTGARAARDAAAFVEERKALMRRRHASCLDGSGRRIKEKISIIAACELYEAKVSKLGADGVLRCDGTTAYQLANLVAILCETHEQRLVSDVELSDFERFRLRRVHLVAPNRQRSEPVKGSTINREIELARRVWRYAARLGYDIGETIEWGEVIDKDAEVMRCRELSAIEEQRLFPVLSRINPDLLVVTEFAILCGQRKKAVIRLRWCDIDWETLEATIFLKTKGENKREHKFPLTARMVEIIRSRPKVGIYIFTYECRRNAPHRADRPARIKGNRFPFSPQGWSRQWRKALAEAQVNDFRWHDLRHTAATRLLRRVNNLKAAQKLLGHTTIDQTARYAHVFNDDLRTMMEDAEAAHATRAARADHFLTSKAA